jgi:glycerate dehydrogenase
LKLNSGVFLDLATIDNGDLNLDALDRTLPEWRIHDLTAPDQLDERLDGASLVVSNKVHLDRRTLAGASDLQMVAVAATGTNVVDLEAAKELGLTVCNLRDYCSESVAQHVLTLMLNLATGQPWYMQRAHSGEWSDSGRFTLHDRPIRELSRMSLGIFGYGALGKAVARQARAVGMTVLLGERRGAKPRGNRLSFEDILANADVVSLHCPLTEGTHGMIDAQALRRMKRDAFLINTARGAIVDEQALAEALRAGEIGGAAVDVFSTEPPPADHPLLALDIPNLLVTPHNAWASLQARQACIDQLTMVIGAFQRGQPLNRVI